MNSIAGYQAFLRRYQKFISHTRKQEYDGFVGFFDRIRLELSRLVELVRQEESVLAPRFNIFQALHIERKETVFHTPMLAHLLDPSASHGQGLLFLKGFLDVVRSHTCSVPPNDEGGHWTVLREFYIAGVGILDILIENPGKGCIIVIENKIDADDHYGQLHRYQNWMDKNRRDYKWRQLIYLTPDGRCPTSSEAHTWLCLSYGEDIARFLRAALGSQQVKARSVQEVLRQYQTIVNHLAEDSYDKAE